MTTTRTIVVGLTAATLLGIPAAAVASTPTDSARTTVAKSPAQALATRHPAMIRYLDFAHVRAAGETFSIRGQVIGRAQNTRGALASATVKLYRQLDGNTAWVYLQTVRTGTFEYPQFTFSTLARQNAHYKVVFGGSLNFLPTQKATWATVHRVFNAIITDGPNVATLHGHVAPYYTGKPIALQKKTCPLCTFVTVKRATTGVGGAYSFGLPAPSVGRWWWRLAIPGTIAFMPSYGGTYSTQNR